jgi:hypothetical protein
MLSPEWLPPKSSLLKGIGFSVNVLSRLTGLALSGVPPSDPLEEYGPSLPIGGFSFLHLQVRFHSRIDNRHPLAVRRAGEIRTASRAPKNAKLFCRYGFYGEQLAIAGKFREEVVV